MRIRKLFFFFEWISSFLSNYECAWQGFIVLCSKKDFVSKCFLYLWLWKMDAPSLLLYVKIINIKNDRKTVTLIKSVIQSRSMTNMQVLCDSSSNHTSALFFSATPLKISQFILLMLLSLPKGVCRWFCFWMDVVSSHDKSFDGEQAIKLYCNCKLWAQFICLRWNFVHKMPPSMYKNECESLAKRQDGKQTNRVVIVCGSEFVFTIRYIGEME